MKTVLVGMGTCGLSAGAQGVLEKLRALAQAQPGACEVKLTGCIGMCFREPLVEVRENGTRVLYGEVDAARAEEIFERHVAGGRVIDEYVVLREDGGRLTGAEIEFMATQERIVLRNCGTIDPESSLVATKDPYTEWLARDEAALSVIFDDNIDLITIAAPKLQFSNIQEGERGGNQIDQIDFVCNRSAAAGDDELTITFASGV